MDYIPGMITEYGPVCNSCSKYFREYKTCSKCLSCTYTVSNRKLEDGTVEMLCQACYNKLLPVCSKCHKQRPSFCHDEQKKPVCEICATEGERECSQCGKEFPAGMGRICRDCVYENMLQKRAVFAEQALSSFMSDLFLQFCDWLKKRRGVLFTATHINNYFSYFFELDSLSQELGRHPTYAEVVGKLTVAKTRKNLLVTHFLNETGLIRVDKKIQEEYSNIDMIERYLDRFQEGAWQRKMIYEYSEYLYSKLAQKKTTVRSMRLALGPAVKLISYCNCFDEQKLTTDILHGYLWKYPGQKSSLTGFINFLNRKYGYSLAMPVWKTPDLSTPKQGHMQLKQQLVDLLRKHERDARNSRKLLRVAIEYLHNVWIPKKVVISMDDVQTTKNGDLYIRLAGHKLYLPKELV